MQVRTSLALTVAGLALGAVATGVQLVRAGLVTEFVGVTPDYVLSGPANPRCTSIGDRQINVLWSDRDDNESGFTVVRQGPLVNGTSTAVFQVPAAAGANSTVTFADTRVVPDSQYTYTIRSFLGPAQSPATSTSDGCSTQSVPEQPTNLAATGGPDTTMSITWNGDGVINEEGYRVYRFATGTDIYLLPGAVGADATLAIDGLDPLNPLRTNSAYCYVVVAYNGQGPAGIPAGARMACGRTWSQQPVVADLQIETPIVALPQFTWKFDDPDPTPPLTEPTQTKVQMQVCDVDFGKDDDIGRSNGCPSSKLRWDSGEISKSEAKLSYLENYPSGLAQHPLDFGNDSYYVRLRAWDDAGTPSEWATLPTGSFKLAAPAGALVVDLKSLEGITLSGSASFNSENGGEVAFGASGGNIKGKFSSLTQVISVKLLASQASVSGIDWQFRRTGDASWLSPDSEGLVTWPSPADSLEWQATSHRAGVIGGFALVANANHPPQVTTCRATRLIGSSGVRMPFTVTVTDPDADFSYDDIVVQFDWDDGAGRPATWQSFDHAAGPLTEFSRTPAWVAQGNYTPTVWVKDQYNSVSSAFPCDTVLVGSATPAWLQTQNADVFSGGVIHGFSPAGQYNATYLVQANGSVVFTSEGLNCLNGDTACPGSRVIEQGSTAIPLPQPSSTSTQPLATILGSVDLAGILSGRYGTVTNYIDPTTDLTAPGGFFGTGSKVLNGAIVHVAHNAVINDPVVLGNAISDDSGAGLIVVDGDLFINAPITYSAEQVQGSLRRLASIGWLVKGNVYIDPAVWAVNSSDATQACPDISQFTSCGPAVVGTFYLYSRGAAANKGIFFTGSASALSDTPLKLGGLVVAQRFALQRNQPDVSSPAEQFLYDGRVFANPPPGLRDFATALPRWRPLAPLP